MALSAMNHVQILEDLGFDQIKISLKASDISRTLKAYQLMAEKVDYPFHAGITEAGSLVSGTAKSAAGIALLLREGLVDTLMFRSPHRLRKKSGSVISFYQASGSDLLVRTSYPVLSADDVRLTLPR